MTAIIEMAGVEYYYSDLEGSGDRRVLKGIDLKVQKGEFLAIIGPNGSGKSTLVKHFNGLLVPTAGRIRVCGMEITEKNICEIRRRVGLLFQNPENQLVSSVVEEDVAFGPENLVLSPKEIRKRVEEALEAVDMIQFRAEPVHSLSGGQKQRIAIAGLLAMRPECIVLDEPTSMLDPMGRSKLYEIILKLNKEGITIILVTHLMEEAVLADRVCIFNHGNILLQGPPRQIFREPDFLTKQNLEVPQMVALATMLRQGGFQIPDSILTVDEMVDYLCTCKQKS